MKKLRVFLAEDQTILRESLKVLITGATGFIGSWLQEALDHQVIMTASRDFVDGEYDTIFHLAPTPIEPVIECAQRTGALVVYASSGAVLNQPAFSHSLFWQQ